MQMLMTNRDEVAWDKGEQAYELGDTTDVAVAKAGSAGYRPGSNGYAAFITAFARQVRSGQVAPRKSSAEKAAAMPGSATILTPDFLRVS
ncbi:MAG: hypothetical protein JWQ23_992 [Herminiimonas sp.]|jgi:hypothetical protein|nr:hypothetical protein [Herminiimonas sp.]